MLRRLLGDVFNAHKLVLLITLQDEPSVDTLVRQIGTQHIGGKFYALTFIVCSNDITGHPFVISKIFFRGNTEAKVKLFHNGNLP